MIMITNYNIKVIHTYIKNQLIYLFMQILPWPGYKIITSLFSDLMVITQ